MRTTSTEGHVTVSRRGAERLRIRHPWVYRSDVEKPTAAPGSIVTVLDPQSRTLGVAFYSSQSQIAVRMLHFGKSPPAIDAEFFRRRLDEADALRHSRGVDPSFSRRIFSEGDRIPGLVVDRYGPMLVVQALTQGVDAHLPTFLSLLQERYQPASILLRNDIKVRALEGLPQQRVTIGEPIPDPISLSVDGRAVLFSLGEGQKTGGYLDQRQNYAAVRGYARGQMLDAFCYSGGFALACADRCDTVEAVDVSANSLDLGRRTAALNGITNISFVEANVFDLLRAHEQSRRRYDTIVLDPPAFAKNRDSLEGAMRGYKELNLRALRLLTSGGVLASCTCSYHMTEDLFASVLLGAAADTGCQLTLLERRWQSADHPVLLNVPETLYLKCFIVQKQT